MLKHCSAWYALSTRQVATGLIKCETKPSAFLAMRPYAE